MAWETPEEYREMNSKAAKKALDNSVGHDNWGPLKQPRWFASVKNIFNVAADCIIWGKKPKTWYWISANDDCQNEDS